MELVVCFAAPVFNYTNAVVSAISIASIVNEIGNEEKELYPQLLVSTALELSKKLGFKGRSLY